MTLSTNATPICLFDDFERTFDGPADPGESLYSYVNRSARQQAAQARKLCEEWFADYTNDATAEELKRFTGDFRSKNDKQHYAAWFELLTHQIFVRFGLDMSIHPELSGTSRKPDFATFSNGSRMLVEATVVAPDKDPFAPSRYEEDVQEKLTQLEIPNFTTRIASVSGPLKRRLKNKEIKREFVRLIAKHDPDIAQQRIDQFGYGVLPTEIASFGDWQLIVELFPLPPGKRAPKKARVAPWPLVATHDCAVPQVRAKIKDKLKHYRPNDDQLILAVNVHNRGGFNLEIDGHDVLFGNDGIWNGRRSCPAVVLFFTETNSYAVPGTQACLYVNPSVDPSELPPALLRLPRAQGSDCSERIEGESLASVLGID